MPKVLQIGSSAGVTISKEALKTLGVRIGDSVEVSVDEVTKTLNVAPLKQSTTRQDEKIAKLTVRFIERYRSDLLALAHK